MASCGKIYSVFIVWNSSHCINLHQFMSLQWKLGLLAYILHYLSVSFTWIQKLTLILPMIYCICIATVRAVVLQPAVMYLFGISYIFNKWIIFILIKHENEYADVLWAPRHPAYVSLTSSKLQILWRRRILLSHSITFTQHTALWQVARKDKCPPRWPPACMESWRTGLHVCLSEGLYILTQVIITLRVCYSTHVSAMQSIEDRRVNYLRELSQTAVYCYSLFHLYNARHFHLHNYTSQYLAIILSITLWPLNFDLSSLIGADLCPETKALLTRTVLA